jgi:predicted nucleic acid-binding protein
LPIFDTAFLIDLTAGEDGAVAMARQVDQGSDIKAISVVTVHEYLRGVFYHFSGKKQSESKLRKALTDLSYFDQLDYTSEIARQAAKVDSELYRSGEITPYADVVIAATAIHHDLPLITRDAHFRAIKGLTVLNY